VLLFVTNTNVYQRQNVAKTVSFWIGKLSQLRYSQFCLKMGCHSWRSSGQKRWFSGLRTHADSQDWI